MSVAKRGARGNYWEYTLHMPVDKVLLKALRLARASQAFLAALPRPPELWEAFVLSHTQRMFLRTWLELRVRRVESETAVEAERAVVQRLADLRREHGPWMAGLKVFMSSLPEVTTEGEIYDLTLALMTVSGREAALAWIADPAGTREGAKLELRGLQVLAESYAEAIAGPATRIDRRERHAPPESASPITRILPRGVTMGTLEDVGRVEDCRKLLKEFDPQVEIWECFCLVTTDEGSRRTIDGLVKRKKSAPNQPIAQDAQELFHRLQEIRREHAEFVRRLAAFLGDLPVGHYGTETRELALGFIVAGPVGREHAAQWLGDPDHYRQEAATKYEGLIGRAMNYQSTLRAFAES